MKRVLLITLIVYTFAYGKAQTVTVSEPEFADQSIFLTSDSTGNLLPREDAILKTKAAASLYLTGIGKIKTRLTLNGITSTALVMLTGGLLTGGLLTGGQTPCEQIFWNADV